MGAPTATTRPVALLGDPVDHSLSPLLHNTAFEQLGLDLVYLALPVATADLGTVLRALGAVGCAGANVTVPHKLAAAALCDETTEVARLVGAVNTLWWQDGALHGDNTDVSGFGRVLDATGAAVPDGRAVVLGTGGAARAAVVALARAGLAVDVVGRRPEAARALVALAEAAGDAGGTGVDLADEDVVARAVAAADVVVNATPLGMAGERLPAAFHRLGPGQVAHDLVYTHGLTPFVADAAAADAAAHDGRLLLAAQAEDAFVRWTGLEPPVGLFGSLLEA